MGLLQTVVLLMVVVIHGDVQVDCVFGGSCVLPCHFQPNIYLVLHWVKQNGQNINVHSYYNNQDQMGYQDSPYQGRTSLFPGQISGGNASLCLSRVNLQDQGRYLCYTSTSDHNKENIITVTVRAPVARVNIELRNDTVTCKSGGIFPRPELTWSVSPPPATVLQNQTEVHENDKGLYDISGSLRTVDRDTESTYSCSVQNEHSARTATIRQHPPMESAPNREVSLPCDASGLYDITWTFNFNQTILSRPAGQRKARVAAEWQQQVVQIESGSLLLTVASSAESEGTYTCTLSDKDETHVTHLELTILKDPYREGFRNHWITLPPFIAFIIGIIILRIILRKNKKDPTDPMLPGPPDPLLSGPPDPLLLGPTDSTR